MTPMRLPVLAAALGLTAASSLSLGQARPSYTAGYFAIELQSSFAGFVNPVEPGAKPAFVDVTLDKGNAFRFGLEDIALKGVGIGFYGTLADEKDPASVLFLATRAPRLGVGKTFLATFGTSEDELFDAFAKKDLETVRRFWEKFMKTTPPKPNEPPAESLLALPPGKYTMTAYTRGGTGQFGGEIEVVPEPASLAALGAPLLAFRRRRCA